MLHVDIDGHECTASKGETILTAASRAGVHIPTLCHHEGLEPFGACRLCLVETTLGGRTRLETACTRPVEDGMSVRTQTDAIVKHRKLLAELLLARCPEAGEIRALAAELGVTESRFEPLDEACVLCGRCVRACQDAIGTSAISFVDRGMDRHVATPFEVNSEVCVGCGACARVCPTGAIQVEDVDDKRYLRYLNTELELRRCQACGEYYTPKRRAEQTAETQAAAVSELCERCRRQRIAGTLRQYVR